MDDRQTLLEAISRDPDDTLAWLALADRLEEEGESERAELSRLTRRVQALDPDDPNRPGLEASLADMLIRGVRPCLPEITNSIGMRFVLVPPGVAWTSPQEDTSGRRTGGPAHKITCPRPFWLGMHPVTQQQYSAAQPHKPNPSVFAAGGRYAPKVKRIDTALLPVDSVSWDDATAFCKRMSGLAAEKKAGRKYRLPTEAEWEFACRGAGAHTTGFLFGESMTSDLCNFDGRRPFGEAPKRQHLGRTTVVGSYPPNALGLFDLMGNVWEWMAREESDSRESRFLRGGSWSSYGWGCRIAYRNSMVQTAGNDNFGMRLVMEPSGAWA